MSDYSLPTYRVLITKFFEDHRESLEHDYPGISLRTLLSNAESYILEHDAQLDDVYISTESSRMDLFLGKLKKGVPLGHICGRSYFFKSEFIVSPAVLIPRSETEILVERAITAIKKIQRQESRRLKVIDLGTGSGAIILSVMQECSNLDCFALDISKDALQVAKRNYFNLEFSIPSSNSLSFHLGDRFQGFPEEKIDLILTNPPYIKEEADLDGVHHNVDGHEPKLALYLPDQEYDQWFIDLFSESFKRLTDGGTFLMEGHEDHLIHLKMLAEKTGFVNVAVICDYTGRHRFLCASK